MVGTKGWLQKKNKNDDVWKKIADFFRVLPSRNSRIYAWKSSGPIRFKHPPPVIPWPYRILLGPILMLYLLNTTGLRHPRVATLKPTTAKTFSTQFTYSTFFWLSRFEFDTYRKCHEFSSLLKIKKNKKILISLLDIFL